MSAPAPRRPGAAKVGSTLHVVMHDTEIARLTSSRAGRAKLTYLPEAEAVTRGLSCSMPVLGVEYRGERVVNWIGGLLPDRSEVLSSWRTQFGLTRSDPYALLWHVGEDVAGAARFIRPERLGVEDDPQDYTPLTEAAIGERIRMLGADAASWAPARGSGQFSLAGAQAKFALALTPGGWIEPTGTHPTTHIFKPAMPEFADQDLSEHLTMRLARAAGLHVADTEVAEFDGARCLVVTRFDRYQADDGTWRRIHQEDAVQALGRNPSQKYEVGRGPGVRQIADLLRANVTEGYANSDVAAFIDAIAFNWLVLGTDAHARNYALVHSGPQTRLAPFYDLNSFLPYRKRGQRPVLAMKVGLSEQDPGRISARDWEELARDCRQDAEQTLARVQARGKQLLDQAAAVLHSEQTSRWKSHLPDKLHDTLVAHASACLRRL